MSGRTAARLAGGLCLMVVVLVAVTETLSVAAWDESSPLQVSNLVFLTLPVPFSVMGGLITARRPGNRIGVLLLAGSIAGSAFQAAFLYVSSGLETGGLPGRGIVAWIANWIWVPGVVALLLLLLLYPNGRLVSGRWRPVVWAITAWGAAALVVMGTSPRLLAEDTGTLANPVGVRGALAEGLRRLLDFPLAEWVPLALVLLSVASLLVRFQRSRGAERQQLKWFAFAVWLVLATGAFSSVVRSDWTSALLWLAIWMVPAAIAIAVLRYRLYDIDRIINRTLVYGLLTALLGTVYAGAVLLPGQVFGGIGGEPSWVIAGGTLAVAALFQPARRRIQQAVDRRFNRRRYDAAQTVEAFSARMRDQIDLDTLSAELLAVVHQTMEPTTASLWLRPSGSAAQQPREGPPRPLARPSRPATIPGRDQRSLVGGPRAGGGGGAR